MDILNGKKGPNRDIVLLNAAAGIMVGGKATSLKEGYSLAKESVTPLSNQQIDPALTPQKIFPFLDIKKIQWRKITARIL